MLPMWLDDAKEQCGRAERAIFSTMAALVAMRSINFAKGTDLRESFLSSSIYVAALRENQMERFKKLMLWLA